MRALIASLALLWTLLLGAIAVQLYQINQSLAWVSAPVRALAAAGAHAGGDATAETRDERIDRKARELHELGDEYAETLRRAFELRASDKSATAPPSRR